MSRNFDIFVKAPSQEVLGDAKKKQALAVVNFGHHNQHKWTSVKLSKQPVVTDIQLQDGAILLSFSHNQL